MSNQNSAVTQADFTIFKQELTHSIENKIDTIISKKFNVMYWIGGIALLALFAYFELKMSVMQDLNKERITYFEEFGLKRMTEFENLLLLKHGIKQPKKNSNTHGNSETKDTNPEIKNKTKKKVDKQ